jgi:hypothetical protein
LDAVLEPGVDVFEPPVVHADLASPVAFSVANQLRKWRVARVCDFGRETRNL